MLSKFIFYILTSKPVYVFLQYADLKTTLAEPNQIRAKPDVSELKFGQIFTDHMLKIFYHKTLGGWQRPVIIPFENVSLHPAAKVLHYAIEVLLMSDSGFHVDSAF